MSALEMDVSQGVIDSDNIRFQKKRQSEACWPRLAKLVVTDTGKIELYSLENKFPPIHLKAANVEKPKRPRSKNTTWISLDIFQNVDAKFFYVNIQANTPSEMDKLYDTLMIAWSPKKSDNTNDDNSIAAAPGDVPPPKKKQTSVDLTAGGGRSARANITEPEGSSLLGFNTDYAKPSSTQNRKQATSDALKRMFDDYGIGNGKDNSRSSNGLSTYDQYDPEHEIAALPKEKSLTRKAAENLFDTKFGKSNTTGNPINTGNNQTVLSNSSKPAPTPRLFVPEKNPEGKRVLELTAELEEVHTQWTEQNAKNASKIRQLKRQLEDERQFSANLLCSVVPSPRWSDMRSLLNSTKKREGRDKRETKEAENEENEKNQTSSDDENEEEEEEEVEEEEEEEEEMSEVKEEEESGADEDEN